MSKFVELEREQLAQSYQESLELIQALRQQVAAQQVSIQALQQKMAAQQVMIQELQELINWRKTVTIAASHPAAMV